MLSGDYEPIVSAPRNRRQEIPFRNDSPRPPGSHQVPGPDEDGVPPQEPTPEPPPRADALVVVPGEDDEMISAHRNDDAWRCADCRTDWPCVIFRRRLRALYANDPDRLRTFMRHFRDRAARDLGGLTPAELDTRFLRWTGPDPAPHHRMRSI